MSLNNLLIVTSSIISSQEIKELLESFFVENNPQRPDNENVLDFSLQVPLPTENINDIEQSKAEHWGTGKNCWNSKIRTKSDKEIVYEFTTQYTIPSLWLISISLKYSKLEFFLSWFNKDDSGTLIVKNGVTTWGSGFHYSL
tara:strand:+ start:474 stop:899 length:426 start_codon:yes stop_codon:yes gene_type:complete